ncbi:MAG: phosphonopyruvate hydrolase [Alphaproteobacteria bacterium]|jgi:phosphonopyruvate hydrolase|nr:phosphonopyruvate hydrolase [Rhodospirillaceae bacterium]MDP6403668.1 phosphonopyruvate hydrolase [Alphaproteobacteria bacterium]MDP6624130.1 phosphonopyruvate hydrolase [Alphaproteobacteria bacterium]|tara:strand:+ start:1077 stop:1949 length:873 start_codon:yes stop_codon:yes gene_type:complete
MSKAARLSQLLAEKPLVHIIGAHNPLGARLAAEAGFDGIWASGFELSAAQGVPDASIVTASQHLEVAAAMNQASEIPVVADVDTGFGNAINVIDTVQRYERAGMAALVIEDKTFPKDTSLLADGRQELLRPDEFAGKIEAAVASRSQSDFMVIARCEALIAGLGQDEARQRSETYVEAGADAILIHSKAKTPDEIVEFVANWRLPTPLVIVPTAYPQLSESDIEALGKVRMVIYGNHGVRAVVTALQEVFGRIRADGGIYNVDGDIVPVERLFELQGVAAMKANEKRFLR